VRNVVLLGSTGSIGTQALDVIARNRDAFRVVALAAAGSRLALGAAAYSILGWEHETAVVWRWNVASPLDSGWSVRPARPADAARAE